MAGVCYDLTEDKRFPMGPFRADVAAFYGRITIAEAESARTGIGCERETGLGLTAARKTR